MKADSAEWKQRSDYDRYQIEPKGFEESLRIGMIRQKTFSSGSNADYFHKIILKQIKCGEDDIIIAPEFTYNFSSKVMNEKEKNVYVEEIRKATEGKDVLVFPGTFIWQDDEEGYAHNSAPVIYDGEVLIEYFKRTDGGSSTQPDKYKIKWIGGDKRGVFEWKGKKAGIEICLDYEKRRLKEVDKIYDLDFYFLISCGTTLKSKYLPVKKGGYGINCNGGLFTSTRIIKKEFSGYSDIPPTDTKYIGSFSENPVKCGFSEGSYLLN